jgi:hypothetical protein
MPFHKWVELACIAFGVPTVIGWIAVLASPNNLDEDIQKTHNIVWGYTFLTTVVILTVLAINSYLKYNLPGW